MVRTGLGKALPFVASSQNDSEVSWRSVDVAGKAMANDSNVAWQGSIGACASDGAAIAASEHGSAGGTALLMCGEILDPNLLHF